MASAQDGGLLDSLCTLTIIQILLSYPCRHLQISHPHSLLVNGPHPQHHHHLPRLLRCLHVGQQLLLLPQFPKHNGDSLEHTLDLLHRSFLRLHDPSD